MNTLWHIFQNAAFYQAHTSSASVVALESLDDWKKNKTMQNVDLLGDPSVRKDPTLIHSEDISNTAVKSQYPLKVSSPRHSEQACCFLELLSRYTKIALMKNSMAVD